MANKIKNYKNITNKYNDEYTSYKYKSALWVRLHKPALDRPYVTWQ